MIDTLILLLQAAFYASGIVTAIVAIVGIYSGYRQLGLFKEQLKSAKVEVKARFERASKERALDLAEKYPDLITQFGERRNLAKRLDLSPVFTGTVSENADFNYENIPESCIKLSDARAKSGVLQEPLNKLEGLAANFVSGVADEEAVFPMMGSSFCSIVENHYDVISFFCSKPNSTFYSNVIKLYRAWSSRLTAKEIEATRDSLGEKLEALKQEKLPKSSVPDLFDEAANND